MITAAQLGLLTSCACGATPGHPCVGVTDPDTRMHADRIEAGMRGALEAIGLPARACLVVAALLRYGAAKHGAAAPGESSRDQDPRDHWDAAMRHAARVGGVLETRDPDSGALHIVAVAARTLLAVDGVMRGEG